MINSPLLANLGGYVGGRWISPGQSMAVINPATGERLADVPVMGGDAVRAGVDAAALAMEREIGVEARAEWLSRIAEGLVGNRRELGRIITLEQGKPLAEAEGEVDYAAGFFRYFAGRLGHLASRVLEERPRSATWTVHHRPGGVAGLITPWNFPLAMLAKKLSASFAAGCASVTKPAEQTPLTAIALWNLLDEMKFPAGWANLAVGEPVEIGRALFAHPAMRIISFTGSTEVGKLLARQGADGLKRLALELGGNAPFIVMNDANVALAVEGLVASKFRAGGQTCVCANRVYVQRAVHDEFVAKLVERMGRLKVGNGMEAGTEIGPLIDRAGFDKVAAHVADAMGHGAQRIMGSEPVRPRENWGCFYPPALLVGADERMRVFREETFGPVVAVRKFDEDEEVILAANGTPYGLAAYVFGEDAVRIGKIIARLQFGHVGWNTGTGPTPEAPFGGMKESGYGREGGIEGLMEFTQTQSVARFVR